LFVVELMAARAARARARSVDTGRYGPPAEELEEGEVDRARDTAFNRCVKVEARSW
jgi:hypothetical protein